MGFWYSLVLDKAIDLEHSALLMVTTGFQEKVQYITNNDE